MSLLDCLGKQLSECEELFGLNCLHVKEAQIRKYTDGTVYYCFFHHGVAIGMQNGLVDVVELYQENSDYAKVASKCVPLPLESGCTGKNLVDIFGEPLEKGGGTKSQPIDIWLRWKSFEVTIKSRDWNEAQNLPWATASIWGGF